MCQLSIQTRSNQSFPFSAYKLADQQTIGEEDYDDADTMKAEKQRQQQQQHSSSIQDEIMKS
jgi:hypothetical protein